MTHVSHIPDLIYLVHWNKAFAYVISAVCQFPILFYIFNDTLWSSHVNPIRTFNWLWKHSFLFFSSVYSFLFFTSSLLIFLFSCHPCPAYLYLWYFLNHTPPLFLFSSFVCPTSISFMFLLVCVVFGSFLRFFDFEFPSPSFPTCSLSPCASPGSTGSSSAGVFPELRVSCAVRPVSGSRDLPHGVDALLVSGAHVGRQLPHCSTPPWGSSYFCLQQDPPPPQH